VWLLVGLGNPGPEYEDSRHNVGFQVVDAIGARTHAPPLREKLGALVAESKIGSERILLCKPMEYMNLSGQAVARVARFWKIAPAESVVVYDDLDLPFGRLKLGAGGGHGGHNGLRSIIAEWATADFHRVRVGIGRPAQGRDAANHVLGKFSPAERKDFAEICARAADATQAIVTDGLTAAMNRFNTKTNTKTSPRAKPGDDA
jgi:peptidyl-tRNA hydrolase, PTH1 family